MTSWEPPEPEGGQPPVPPPPPSAYPPQPAGGYLPPPPGAYPPPPAGGYPPPPPGAYPPPSYAYPPPPPPGYAYGEPPAPVPGGRRGSMGARFGGLVIDTLILIAVVAVIGLVFGGFHKTTSTNFVDGTTTSSFTTAPWLSLVALLIQLAYFGYFVGLRGASPGHRATGLRVVDVNTAQHIGFWRAVLRSFVLAITGAICTLGYWTPFFDSQRRQGWHDKSAKAVVIPRS